MSNDGNTLLAGSSPAKRTSFPEETNGSALSDTVQTQETPESAEKVRFPKKVRHRKQGPVLATIYAKAKTAAKGYQSYRVAWRIHGQRKMQSFETYSAALKHAEKLVEDLHKGSAVTALSPAQARDALTAFERLQGHYQSTGKRVSLLTGISEYCEATARLNGHTLSEAITGFLGTVASVKRKDIGEAVEEFIKAEEPRTKATNGQRAQLSPKYHYNRAIQLRRFAATFPNYAVADLTKEHLDTFFSSLGEFSAKSRNHHRAAVQQFLGWCVRKDYMSMTHRLGEADAMRPEHANTAEILFYTPKEFQTLLEAAEGPMRAMIAMGGLAGLRTAELLRLDWADVWRVAGHIEITAGKSKTRQRRLAEICPALAAWLQPFRSFTTGKVWTQHEITFHEQFVELCEGAKVKRKPNGLRHAFCSYHFAAHANENLTASLSGHAPAMVHGHYKGLATRKEALKWFAVRPAKARAANVIPLTASAVAR